MLEKCSLCDGPVANGRCRLCGMPYKNDEILYHLNERRGDHYRHATAKARKEMREDELALPDKGKTVKKVLTRDEIRAKQQEVRREAVERMTNTRVPVENRKTAGRKHTYGNPGEKKNRKSRLILWILFLIIVIDAILGFLPAVVDKIQEHVQGKQYESELPSIWGDDYEKDFQEEPSPLSFQSDGLKVFFD